MSRRLRDPYIEQRQPILERLEGKAAKDERDAEDAEPPFRKIVRIVLNVGIHGDSDTGDDAGDQSYSNRERPGVVDVMHEETTDECGGDVAYRPNYSSPELAAGKAGTAIGDIVDSGTHTARIGDDLSDGNEDGKGNCKTKAQLAVESGAETQSADGGEQCLPWQRVVIQPAGSSIEFDGDRNACSNSSGNAEEETEPEAVSDAEDDGVRHRPGKQSQRAMAAAQQVIGKIQTANHIKAGARYADGGDGVMVHWVTIVEGMGADRSGLPVGQ
jgi:hypothetical protein